MKHHPSAYVPFTRTFRLALAALALDLSLGLLPVREAYGQGTINFRTYVSGQTQIHIYAPLPGNNSLSQVGNAATGDYPAGTTDWSGWSLIGANGNNVQYGGNGTFAALLAASGLYQPETSLLPAAAGGITTFRTGAGAGTIYATTPTFNNLVPDSTGGATVQVVAWDNSSGLFPTWAVAREAWLNGRIAAGKSPLMNITAPIGGNYHNAPTLPDTDRSFNLYAIVTNRNPPSIIGGPTSQTVQAGQSATFSVTASGFEPLNYQWFFNGTNILEGATTEVYRVTNAQPADMGGYSVVVTNLAGSVTSAVAQLRVLVVPTIGLSSLSVSATNCSISLNSVSGLSYWLEFKGSLGDATWTPLLPAVAGNGGMITLQDTNSALLPSRFYRVRCE